MGFCGFFFVLLFCCFSIPVNFILQLRSVSSWRLFFRSSFGHILCQRCRWWFRWVPLLPLAKPWIKMLTRGGHRAEGLRFKATDNLSMLTSSSWFGFNISASYVQLILLSHCPPSLIFSLALSQDSGHVAFPWMRKWGLSPKTCSWWNQTEFERSLPLFQSTSKLSFK